MTTLWFVDDNCKTFEESIKDTCSKYTLRFFKETSLFSDNFKNRTENEEHIVFLDIFFDEKPLGLKLLSQLRKDHPLIPILIISSFDGDEHIKQAVKEGAIFFCHQDKLKNKNEIEKLINESMAWIKQEKEKEEGRKKWKKAEGLEVNIPSSGQTKTTNDSLERVRTNQPWKPGVLDKTFTIVGEDDRMLKLFEAIEMAAENSDRHVMIYGETGTGKELVARAVHYLSKRKEAPFEIFNMSGFSGESGGGIDNSLLFGCPSGFTDTRFPVEGLFMKASNVMYQRDTEGHRELTGLPNDLFQENDGHGPGTLFLDEIHTANPTIQARLLRILEEKVGRDLAGNRFPADCRIIASTNKKRAELLNCGAASEFKFREDLLNRLEGIRIEVPSLNEHKADMEILVNHFIERYAGEQGIEVPPYVIRYLKGVDWTNKNVRVLERVISQSISLTPGNMLMIPAYIDHELKSKELRETKPERQSDTNELIPERSKEEVDKKEEMDKLIALLLACGSNITVTELSNKLKIRRESAGQKFKRVFGVTLQSVKRELIEAKKANPTSGDEDLMKIYRDLIRGKNE